MKQPISRLVLVASVLLGCGVPHSENSEVPRREATAPATLASDGRLWLGKLGDGAPKGGSGIVANQIVGSSAPRIIEVRLRATNAHFLSATPSEATTAADKQLVAQPTEDGARFVIFSSANTNTIGSGELFEATFEPTGEGPVTIEILTDDPIMAPAEAQVGLIVGDPITL